MPQLSAKTLHTLNSPVDAQGSEFTVEDSPHGSGGGATEGGPPPHGSVVGGEAGDATPQGSVWPQGPVDGAGVTDGGGDGPVDPGAAGAPHGSTVLSSIRED